ncbi:peptide deformylase [Lentzea sp. NPDC004782]|uniref:peptide deformylase n=1 Tax=Lentzea sp. NPDC004782 TaxID=3154458 RepID=UPI00339E512F
MLTHRQLAAAILAYLAHDTKSALQELRRDLARADRAVVRSQDKNGRPLVIKATGYFARCVQHKTDHLNGTLYVDHLSPGDRETALAEMEQKRDDVLAGRAERARHLDK